MWHLKCYYLDAAMWFPEKSGELSMTLGGGLVRQKAVTAYSNSKQSLPFGFALTGALQVLWYVQSFEILQVKSVKN